MGKKYKAPVNLRFDDTNPIVENNVYLKHIKQNIRFLGFKWDKECYASDYFNILYKWAIKLIKENKAYVDNLPKEVINFQRQSFFINGICSDSRNRTISENLFLFDKMSNGYFKEGSYVLRAKIDMNSSNINMRDPIMYRILYKKHYRTGKKWCIYPTYDWAHGQCDYIEQISHSLCSLEFENKRPLYNWFIKQLYNKSNIIPKQIEFSRLNISNSITSKRQIYCLIKHKIIKSWEDPRLLTISGLKKRGYTSISLKDFIKGVGITKRNSIVEYSLLEFYVRKHLNKISIRVMVVLNPIKVIIDNYPENKVEFLTSKNYPKNLQCNFRKIPFSKYLYIESDDFLEKKKLNFFRLYIGNKVRLKNAYIIKADYVIKDSTGKIQEIHCSYYPNSKSGNKNINNYKVKCTLHWVSISHCVPIKINLYKILFSKKKLPSNFSYENIFEYINKNSKKLIYGYSEPFIKTIKTGIYLQFQRIGYFYSINNNYMFNKIVSIKNKWKK